MSVEFDRESPGDFNSRTLSREALSRWTGRTTTFSITRIESITIIIIITSSRTIITITMLVGRLGV